jgi:tellurite resistance protein TerC
MLRNGLLITYKWARRIAVAIVGFTVLVVGIAMIVLPGPAFIVIPVGLGILSIEFAWARRWLRKVKERSAALVGTLKNGRSDTSAGGAPPGAATPKRDKHL